MLEKEYSSTINKPKQIVAIDRCSLKKMHNQLIDTIIQVCQTEILLYNMRGVEMELNHTFEMSFKKFVELCFTKEIDYEKTIKRTKETEVNDLVNELQEIKFQNVNELNYESLVVLPYVNVDIMENNIKFRLEADLLNALMSKSKIIGEVENFDKVANYVSYNKDILLGYSLKEGARCLYENVIMNLYQLKKYKRNSYSVEFNDLKKLIGISSDDLPYCKRKIKEYVKDINEKTNLSLHYEVENRYIAGKTKRISIPKVYKFRVDFENSKYNNEVKDLAKHFIKEFNDVKAKLPW